MNTLQLVAAVSVLFAGLVLLGVALFKYADRGVTHLEERIETKVQSRILASPDRLVRWRIVKLNAVHTDSLPQAVLSVQFAGERGEHIVARGSAGEMSRYARSMKLPKHLKGR